MPSGAVSSGASAQARCPEAAGSAVEEGWTAYRSGEVDEARRHFERAAARCADHPSALTGLGYVAMRSGEEDEARRLLERVVTEEPGHVDALTGLGILAWRAGDLPEVAERFRRVLQEVPDHPTALDYLARLPPGLGPPPDRPPLELPDTLTLPARTRGEGFEVRGPGGGWEPFWIKGVNLGAALPGRYPSQFPDSATYAGWIASMAEMGANVVRLYTIHPPHFYEALAQHNRRHPDEPLRLIHGVWTEPPPGDDYEDPAWEGEFFEEMRRVVDLVHGRADLRPRPGHASGFYTEDVSDWVLAYIIGREWEPYSVAAFDSLAADRRALRSFRGEYLAVEGGNAMDAWLAKAVEEMVAYETETYREQRPVAYTNWPTLDPLRHPTETTRRAEVAIREALGETVRKAPREYDNDSIAVDAALVRPTEALRAGYFASYHAYPYYPDFMVLRPSYREASSSMGPSAYTGYLRELKAHHPGMPVVIAEYGVPASFGNAHLQPNGWHHGGHTEEEMASVDRRLTLELAEAGMAGGAVFAWIDEWFKKNWLVLEFELPPDRNRLWWNRLDAEQHYGIWAMEPVPAVEGATLAQRREAWRSVDPLYRDADGAAIRAAADEAYLWLLVEGAAPEADEELFVGFDVFDPERGDRRWPGARGPEAPVGLEFVLRASDGAVRLLVDPPQNPFRMDTVGVGARGLEGRTVPVDSPPPGLFRIRKVQAFNRPHRTRANRDGRYDSLRVITNRRRFGRDSTEYLAMGYDRGVLREGPPPDGSWQRSGDLLEVRIPWMLLNVTDPSSRTILQGSEEGRAVRDDGDDLRARGPSDAGGAPDGGGAPDAEGAPQDSAATQALGTERIDGIGIVAALREGEGQWRSWPAVSTGPDPSSPDPSSSASSEVATFRWSGWEEPRWRARRRPVWEALRRAFEAVDGDGEILRAPGANAVPARSGPDPATSASSPNRVPATDTIDAVADSADVAWRQGDPERARELYARVLAADSTRGAALHRMALMTAWEERHEEALRLFDRLLERAPGNLSARVDRARVLAWRGDLEEALGALDEVLERDPTYRPAMEARARFLAWAGRYDASLSAYDELGGIVGSEPELQRARAQVLGWASRFDAARAVYDSILAEDPDDVDARLGMARVHAFADELERAEELYREVLSDDPDRPEALRGLARTVSWAGRLVEGERLWRRAVEGDSADVEALVGLGQNLRWQGRPAAALEVLERAEERSPDAPDVRQQLRTLRTSLAPAAEMSFAAEGDSDDNAMTTTALTARWHPWARLELRADAYLRSAEQGTLDHEARGLSLTGSYVFDPGWRLTAGGGWSGSDGGGRDSFGRWSVTVGSPRRHPLSVDGHVRGGALDATAALVANGVERTEYGLDARWTPAPGWVVRGSVGGARVRGDESNRRVNGAASITRRVGGAWRLGLAARAFSYEKDLREGYFDPDFYGIAELLGSWRWERAGWSMRLEAAPGVQQVTSDGDPGGTFRVSGRLARRFGPGREVALSGGLSSTGLQSFSTGASDYRYRSLRLSLTWAR